MPCKLMTLAFAATILSFGAPVAAQTAGPHALAQEVMNVVLVHGAFADGSGWRGVAVVRVDPGFPLSH